MTQAQQPAASGLTDFHREIDTLIDQVTALIDGVEKYGDFLKWIPGISGLLTMAEQLKTGLAQIKTFLDWIPGL